jgi:hypothetical protein
MNGKAEIETERDGLKRIVALLFSFAGLAERAAGRSYPVRCLVLWLLRRAEIIARDWIAEGSPDAMQPAGRSRSCIATAEPRRCILAEPSALAHPAARASSGGAVRPPADARQGQAPHGFRAIGRTGYPHSFPWRHVLTSRAISPAALPAKPIEVEGILALSGIAFLCPTLYWRISPSPNCLAAWPRLRDYAPLGTPCPRQHMSRKAIASV